MKTGMIFDQEAREKLLLGVEKLANAVKITLGPMGKTVAICLDGQTPHLTKDGVTVANAISLPDAYENIGAALVREAAQRSAAVAGDGTTTATVLAYEIIKQGDKVVASGYPTTDILAGMRAASIVILEELEKTRVQITSDRLIDVATISANGDRDLGKLISDAINRVGPDGAVSVQEAKGYDTTLNIVDGTYIDRGYESPYFATDPVKQLAELEAPDVLIINDEISSLSPLVPALERISMTGGSLLIVCNAVGGEALQALVLNRIKANLKVCVIKSPEFGAARIVALQDLASLVGGQVITDAKKTITAAELDVVLGHAKKATITNRTTLLFGTQQTDEVKQKQTRAREILDDPSFTLDDKKIAERRLRRLSDGIAVLQIGGATESEMKERRDRVDDALHAARVALKEGVQPGGGVALTRAKKRAEKQFKSTDAFGVGARVFLDAMEAPIRQIAENCGVSPDLVVQKVKRISDSHGYDGKHNKYGDMFELGILDPHAVIVSAVEHSLSVACNLLSIGCIIAMDGVVSPEAAFFDNV
jgi:chaperonin GroEL